MVSIGGKVVTPNASRQAWGATNGVPDPWEQGIGIFDMSELEWKSEYDPSAPPYVTPDVIQSYYNENGHFPKTWSNPTIERWFKDMSTSNHTYWPQYFSDLFEEPKHNTTSSATKNEGSSHTGAIAGGVFGGVAAITLIILAIYLYRRHVSKSARQHGFIAESEEAFSMPRCEMDSTENPKELYGTIYQTELPVHEQPMELPADSAYCKDSRCSKI